MMHKHYHILTIITAALGFLLTLSPVQAAPISLLPTKWNMISSVFPTNSDGSGYHTFVGGGRETLLQFDLSGIPAGATINSAVLTMYMDRSQVSSPANQPVFVYRATSSWGMGTSGAGAVDNGITGGGGQGYPVANNDATWAYRFYNATTPAASTPWTTAGGDYAATASAYSLVGSGFPTTGTPGPGAAPFSRTWSGAGMVADVQSWLDGLQANDGWLLTDYASATIIHRQAAL